MAITCEYCKNVIDSKGYISFADYSFCTDVCQLKFQREQMPNLGGSAISEEDIRRVEQASGDERIKLRADIFTRTMEAFDSSDLMKAVHEAAEENEKKSKDEDQV